MLDGDSRYPAFKKPKIGEPPSIQHGGAALFIDKQPIPTPSMNPNRNVTGQAYSIDGERAWSTGLCTLSGSCECISKVA
jgi:hypothetical protein